MRSSSAAGFVASLVDASVDVESAGAAMGAGWEKMASSSLLSVGWTRFWPIKLERYWDALYAVQRPKYEEMEEFVRM